MKRQVWLVLFAALFLAGCRAGGGEPGRGIDLSVDAGGAEREETSAAGERSLTDEELAWFDGYLNRVDNNGFLLSEYDSPEHMNLEEVFYNGAGLALDKPPEEEIQAYLKAWGRTETDTDVIRIAAGQIDEFLMKKAGIRLKDTAAGFSWTYLPQYDSYINEHGDTNFMKLTCRKGSVAGDIYTVYCENDPDGGYQYACTVTLRKKGEDFLFMANRIDRGGWRYEEESETEDLDGPIFESGSRYYTREELESLGSELCAVFRNEIYARHGYLFSSDKWIKFFEPYSWYEGKYPAGEFDTGRFNKYEIENLKTVTELGD